jgi:hypothetical protein
MHIALGQQSSKRVCLINSPCGELQGCLAARVEALWVSDSDNAAAAMKRVCERYRLQLLGRRYAQITVANHYRLANPACTACCSTNIGHLLVAWQRAHTLQHRMDRVDT